MSVRGGWGYLQRARRFALAEYGSAATCVASLRTGMIGRTCDATAGAGAELAADDAWSSLEGAKQAALLEEHGLVAPTEPAVATPEALAATLDRAPLAARRSELAAVPARLSEARLEAAKVKAPTARPIPLPRRTLENEQDVQHYVDEIAELLQGAPLVDNCSTTGTGQ